MRKDSVPNVTVSAIVPRDFYHVCAEDVAGSGPGRQVALGWFDELTAPGFRLVWEERRLFLVAIAGLSAEDLVADLKRRRRWIKKNRNLIQDRVEAIVGLEGIEPDVLMRVVVPETTGSLMDYLGGLGEYVDLWVVRFPVVGGALQPHGIARPIGKPPRVDRAGVEKNTSPQLRDFWVELRRTASEALRGDPYVDRFDWRTDPHLNLLRSYALLVVIASALVVEGLQEKKPGSRSPSRSRTPRSPTSHLEEVLGLLVNYAKAAAAGRFLPDERVLAKTLKATVSLAEKHLRGVPFNLEGADLRQSWKTPVPPSIQSMIGEMKRSVEATARSSLPTQGKKDGDEWLADANFGVAAAVHVAQTFDDRDWPRAELNGDPAYAEAALIRVLAGHRLLLEMLGVSARSGAADLLALADKIAESKTLDAFFTKDRQDQDYLSSVRRQSLAVLVDPGRLTSIGKRRGSLLKQAKTQEQFVLAAMEAALRSGC